MKSLCFRLVAVVVLLSACAGSRAETSLVDVVKRAKSAVVTVLVYDAKGKAIGLGSGFFVDSQQVITSWHVVAGAAKVRVKTAAGKTLPVQAVVAADEIADLARLKLSAALPGVKPLSPNPLIAATQRRKLSAALPGVKPLTLAKSEPEIGTKVVVLGSPEGLEFSASDGIVSAVRSVEGFGRFLQITAPISKGSSGSPVLNTNAEVVGVVTSYMAEGQNLNFAISSRHVRSLLATAKAPEVKRRDTDTEWSAHATKAASLFLQGNYAEAVPELETLTRDDTANEFVWLCLGYCYSQVGQFEKAVVAYSNAIRLKPEYAEAHGGLGGAYLCLRRYDEAIASCKKAIRIKPDLAEAHGRLGGAYLCLRRYDEAIASCKEAIRIKPDLAEAHLIVGYACFELGRYDEAIAACKEAIRLKPDLAEAYHELGAAYVSVRRYDDAIAACKEAIRLKPDAAEAHCTLGNAYSGLGSCDEGVAEYREAIRLKPDYVDAHYNLGTVYARLGRHENAVTAFKEAIRLKPDYAEAHCNLGLTYCVMGKKSDALDEYRILKDLDANMAKLLFEMIYPP